MTQVNTNKIKHIISSFHFISALQFCFTFVSKKGFELLQKVVSETKFPVYCNLISTNEYKSKRTPLANYFSFQAASSWFLVIWFCIRIIHAVFIINKGLPAEKELGTDYLVAA